MDFVLKKKKKDKSKAGRPKRRAERGVYSLIYTICCLYYLLDKSRLNQQKNGSVLVGHMEVLNGFTTTYLYSIVLQTSSIPCSTAGRNLPQSAHAN